METDREELIPEVGRLRPWLWIWVAIGSGVLMLLLIWLGPRLPIEFNSPIHRWGRSSDGAIPIGMPPPVWLGLDLLLNSYVRTVVVLVVFWIGFARPNGRERWLLVGGIYLMALFARPLISDAFSTPGGDRVLDSIVVYATIAFGGLLFLVDRSSLPITTIRVLGSVLALLVIAGLFFPVWAGYAVVSEVFASGCFDAMLFAFGVAIAQFNGIDLFQRFEGPTVQPT